MSDPCAFAACIAWDGRQRPEEGEGLLVSINHAHTRAGAEHALATRRKEPGFLLGDVVEGDAGLMAWLDKAKTEPAQA